MCPAMPDLKHLVSYTEFDTSITYLHSWQMHFVAEVRLSQGFEPLTPVVWKNKDEYDSSHFRWKMTI